MGRTKFSAFYQFGAAMGWSPEQVGRASLWQFNHAVAGWRASQSAKDEPEPLSEEEYLALL